MVCDYEKYKTSTFTGKQGNGKIYMIKTFGESLKGIKVIETTEIGSDYFGLKIDNLNAFLENIKKLEPKIIMLDEIDMFKNIT